MQAIRNLLSFVNNMFLPVFNFYPSVAVTDQRYRYRTGYVNTHTRVKRTSWLQKMMDTAKLVYGTKPSLNDLKNLWEVWSLVLPLRKFYLLRSAPGFEESLPYGARGNLFSFSFRSFLASSHRFQLSGIADIFTLPLIIGWRIIRFVAALALFVATLPTTLIASFFNWLSPTNVVTQVFKHVFLLPVYLGSAVLTLLDSAVIVADAAIKGLITLGTAIAASPIVTTVHTITAPERIKLLDKAGELTLSNPNAGLGVTSTFKMKELLSFGQRENYLFHHSVESDGTFEVYKDEGMNDFGMENDSQKLYTLDLATEIKEHPDAIRAIHKLGLFSLPTSFGFYKYCEDSKFDLEPAADPVIRV